jgi:DNA-binding HxlR family transcriptional regulator
VVRRSTQSRESDRAGHLEAVAACPGHQVLKLLGNKWVSLILKELGDGRRRYGDLSRAIAGSSKKMLTQTLRELERDGLILRIVSRPAPLEVNYQLTALGTGLLEAMHVVVDWAERHTEDMDSARTTFDGGIRRDDPPH